MANKLGDYIVVKVPGVPKPQKVERGPLSDESWKQIKDSAGQRIVEVHEGGKVVEVRPASVVPSNGKPDVRPARVEQASGEPDVRPAVVDVANAPKEDIKQVMADLSPEEWAAQREEARAKGGTPVYTGSDPITRAALEETAYGEQPPKPASGLDVVGDIARNLSPAPILGRIGNAIENTIFPTPEKVVDADPLDTPPAQPGTPPMLARPPEQPMLPDPNLPNGGLPTAGGKVGVSASASGRGPGAPDQTQQIISDAQKNVGAYEQATTDIIKQRASAEEERRNLMADAMGKDAVFQSHVAGLQDRMQADMNEGRAALTRLQGEMDQISKESIDPNRFWNNKSVGQKAAAVIAGALFGATGQGMQWLQRIDGLVDQDIRAQQADLTRRESLLGKKMTLQENLIDMARRQGLDAVEAEKAARMMMWQSVEQQFQQIAATTANLDVKQRANDGVLAAQQKQTDFRMDAEAQRQRNAQARYGLALQRMALEQKGAAGPKMREVSPTLIKQYTTTINMVESLKKMKELAANGGFFDRASRRVKENLTSEEKAARDQYDALRFQIARDRAGSSLQKPEQEALLPLLGDRSGLYDPTPALDQAIDMALTHLDNEVMGAQSGTSGDITPVIQKLQSLKAAAGGGVQFTPSR